MFGNTKTALSKTTSRIKSISFYFHIVFYLLGIAVPVNNIINSNGFLPLHIASMVVSSVLLSLYIIYRDTDDKKAFKAKRKKAKKAKRIVKNLTRIYFVVTTIYTISFTSKGVSILLTVFAVVVLIISLAFEFVRWILEKQIKAFTKYLKGDEKKQDIVYERE